jgi:hypothetical protein
VLAFQEHFHRGLRRAVIVPTLVPPLVEDAPGEDGVAQEVAAPEAAGLEPEAAEPFPAIVGQPAGTAGDLPGEIVEEGADGHDDRHRVARHILHHPDLLAGHPHPYEQDVGSGVVDALEHLVILFVICSEVAVVGGDPEAREARTEALGGGLGDAGQGTKEEEVVVLAGATLRQLLDPVWRGVTLREGRAQQVRGHTDAVTVTEDEVGAVGGVAEGVVALGEVDGEGVGIDDYRTLAGCYNAHRPGEKFFQADGMHLHARYPGGGWQ